MPYFLAEIHKKLVSYETDSKKITRIKKATFIRYRDSIAIISNGKKQAFFHLNSGTAMTYKYDSLHFFPDFDEWRLRMRRRDVRLQRPLISFKKGKIGLCDIKEESIVSNVYDSILFPFKQSQTVAFVRGKFKMIYSTFSQLKIVDSIDHYAALNYRIPANHHIEDAEYRISNNLLLSIQKNQKRVYLWNLIV